MKKIAFLSSFWIKILAIVFMTLDHLGMFFSLQYPLNQTMIDISNVFRIFGRLALPLFRLGIVGSIVSIPFIIFTFSNVFSNVESIYRHGNIFIDLLLTAIAIYCIKHHSIKIKLITLLHLPHFILSFIFKG